jgi:tetratricopeptide (TPR) repeat protein
MSRAVRAYGHDRYLEALRITRVLVDQVPESPAVHELHGLVCYRLGRWREAVSHLEAARTLAGDDASQLPVIMDCRRAQGQHRKVEALWEELRSSSPPADVLSEGRLVVAAHRADRGELDSAIDLLASAGAGRNLRRPAQRHLRQWYVLADLYERAGDLPHARGLFARVVAADPELADARQRLADLGRSTRSRRSSRGVVQGGDSTR